MNARQALRRRGLWLAIILLLAVALAGVSAAWASTSGGGYAIDWFTIDGGGGTSTGGGYSLSGSIGQPDAGPAQAGGSYALQGGFWVGLLGPAFDLFVPFVMR